MVLIFFLHAAVLLGLLATAGEAAAETTTRDHHISYGLSKEYTEIPVELDPGPDGGRRSFLLTQSEYPIRDEHAIDEDEKPVGIVSFRVALKFVDDLYTATED